MKNFIQSRILPLILGSAAVLVGTTPAHALTWNFTVNDPGIEIGTGQISYTGIGNGTYSLTGLSYVETLPDAGAQYVLDTAPIILDIGGGQPGINSVTVVNGQISKYDFYGYDSTATLGNYGRAFVSNYLGIGNAIVAEYTALGGNQTSMSSVSFTQAATGVPFDIPGGATFPALGSVLALGIMKKSRKSGSKNLSTTSTERIN